MVRRIASQRAMQMKRKASESKVGLYTESSLFRSSTWNTYSWWHNPRWHCWQAPNNIARSKANFEIEFLTKNKYMNSPQCCQEQPGTRCIFLKKIPLLVYSRKECLKRKRLQTCWARRATSSLSWSASQSAIALEIRQCGNVVGVLFSHLSILNHSVLSANF